MAKVVTIVKSKAKATIWNEYIEAAIEQEIASHKVIANKNIQLYGTFLERSLQQAKHKNKTRKDKDANITKFPDKAG